jgi:hypothetical protein
MVAAKVEKEGNCKGRKTVQEANMCVAKSQKVI